MLHAAVTCTCTDNHGHLAGFIQVTQPGPSNTTGTANRDYCLMEGELACHLSLPHWDCACQIECVRENQSFLASWVPASLPWAYKFPT